MIKETTFYFILSFMTQIGFSQNINISVIKTESYKRFDKEYNSIRLTTKIDGIKIDSNNMVRLKKISKAVDNNETHLQHEEVFMGDNFMTTNNLKIEFKESLKKTKSITSLQGVIEYFQISKKNNSLLITNDILNNYHIDLFKESSTDMKLMLIDETHFFKLRWTEEKKYYETLQRLKDEEKIGKTIDYFFKQFFSLIPFLGENWKNYYKDHLVFYIENIKDSFFSIQIFNAQGVRIDNGYNLSPGDHNLTVSLKEGEKSLNGNLTLKMKLKNTESIKELQFSLK